MPRLLTSVLLVVGLASSTCAQTARAPQGALDSIAESYVKLALRLGLYDPDFVDAYLGPAEWKPGEADSAQAKTTPVAELGREADRLLTELQGIPIEKLPEIERRRIVYLRAQLVSLRARVDMLSGKRLIFDEESKAIYDIVAPQYNVDSLDAALEELDAFLPGTGDLVERAEAYRKQFIVPQDKIDTVFKTAIAEARRRTRQHIALPADERFTSEYVTGVSWAAYNWYKGNNHSIIQVNADVPFYVSSAIAWACHEGYPGHHVQNVLVEKYLLRGRGWVEYSVYPLFCPTAPLSEGGAEYAVELAFPDSERVAFEKQVLFPLAGLDSAKVEDYYRYRTLTKRLKGAGIEGDRRYLDGKISREEAIAWIGKYSLRNEKESERSVRFAEKYRSYVITYTLGEDQVKAYVERRAAAVGDPARRWEFLRDLFAIPHVPSDLL